MAAASPRAASRIANSPLFRESVESLLNSWPALRIAVAQQAGGRDSAAKAQWLVGVIAGFFADNDDLCPDEVSGFVADIMDVEFDLLIEDGSLEELGQHICEAFRLVATGSEAELRAKLACLRPPDLGQFRDLTNEPDEELKVEVDDEAKDSGEAAASSPNDLPGRLQRIDIASSTASESSSMQSCQNPGENMETDADDGWTVVSRKKK